MRFLDLSLLEPVLQAAIRVDGAFGGYLSKYEPRDRTLDLVTATGMPPALTAAAGRIALNAHTACAQAARERRRVVIRDVATDAAFAPFISIATLGGFRAVQATPLIATGRRLLGCMSTLFAAPHHPPPESLKLLDAYGRIASQVVEAVQLHAELPAPRVLSRAAAHAADRIRLLVPALLRPGGQGLVEDAERQLTALVGELRAQSRGSGTSKFAEA